MNGTKTLSPPYAVVAVFAVSAAMLAYEILLTRIASVLLTSQYLFLIIGVSLLGVSAGAVVEYYLANRADRKTGVSPGLWLSWSSVVLVISTGLVLIIGLEGGLFILALSAGLPFAVTGFILSRFFRLLTSMTGILYAADLTGAAAGALSIPLLLPALGPGQSIILLAAILGFAGAAGELKRPWGTRTFITLPTALLIAGVFYLNRGNAMLGEVPIGKNPDKDLYRLMALQGGTATVVDSRWSTFGRTDLVRFHGDSTMMSLFIDGAAGTNMLRFNGDLADSSRMLLQATQEFAGMIPLLNLRDEQKDNALIIGPGGGRDVLLTLKAAFREITAVEINPEIVEIVRDYRNFNGGIYTDFDNVDVVVAEGRNFLRHSTEKYDLIMLFMPITKSSRSLNAFVLSESYLFTKEAFTDYHRHLTDEGSLLIMAHGMPEITKMMTTAIAAMQDEGLTVQQGMRHLYILGSAMMPLFGLRKTPLQNEESDFLHAAVHTATFDSRYSYIPGVEQKLLRPPLPTTVDAGIPMMNPAFIALAEGKLSLNLLERGTGFNFVPATDDRPFFFQYSFGVPEAVLTVLWLALVALAVVALVPGYRSLGRSQEGRRFSWWLPIFFVAIGVGYIVLELALFQRFIFYLGDPSRTLAVMLASLLVGSGVGSFVSRNSTDRVAILGGFLSAVTASCLLIFIPAVFAALHGSSLQTQLAISAIILFVQGVPMGLMFPIGLRVAELHLGKPSIPWMWAINGSASVVGSALAVAIAISAGYTWSLIFGAFSYLLAALSMHFASRQGELVLGENH